MSTRYPPSVVVRPTRRLAGPAYRASAGMSRSILFDMSTVNSAKAPVNSAPARTPEASPTARLDVMAPEQRPMTPPNRTNDRAIDHALSDGCALGFPFNPPPSPPVYAAIARARRPAAARIGTSVIVTTQMPNIPQTAKVS